MSRGNKQHLPKKQTFTPEKQVFIFDNQVIKEEAVEQTMAEMLELDPIIAVDDLLEKVEEKFSVKEEPSLLNHYGYRSITSAPRNGTLIFVSSTGEDKGEMVFWKKTRAFANATHRWEDTGFFVNVVTNLRVVGDPKFWRMRVNYEI